MKIEVFGVVGGFGIFGDPRFLGTPIFWGVKSQFFGVKTAKKLGIFFFFLETPEIWDFFGIFGVVHGLSNILMFSMCVRASSGYFFSPS